MREHQTYNLPGFGLMRIQLYPYALAAFELLEKYNHITLLREIDQLGAIRDVLPGAHHTRFEYLMAQLALLTELCHLQGSLPEGIALGRNRNTFGSLSTVGRPPSNGEVLMVMALLGNAGHLPTTFSGERALLKYLVANGDLRRVFRSGLRQVDRAGFDQVVRDGKLYELHYYIVLFLLNRYRRRAGGAEIVNLCSNILTSYLARGQNDQSESLSALWKLYQNIRRVTYLALDSHYAPVPFSLDLTSIFFSLDHFVSDVFQAGTAFQEVLGRLEGVMRDTVYLAPPTLQNHARVSEGILARLGETRHRPTSIRTWWKLLRPENVSEIFGSLDGSAVGAREPFRGVALSYTVPPPEVTSQVLSDPMGWEADTRSRVGTRSCRFAAEFDPPKTQLKVSADLTLGVPNGLAWRVALRVTKQLVDLDRTLEGQAAPRIEEAASNRIALVRFLLRIAFPAAQEFRLRQGPIVRYLPVVREYGSTRAGERIAEYNEWGRATGLVTPDGRNELDVLERTLRKIDYRGAVLAFGGSAEVLVGGQALAEFDGLIFLLSRKWKEPTLLVVEGKNTVRGNRQAERQLREQCARLGISEQQFEVEHVGARGAFAKVTLGGTPK